MAGHGRQSVDVHALLEAAEWRELFGENLRRSGFWSRTAGVAAVIVVAAVAAAALGAPTARATAVAAALLCALALFATSYAVIDPWLRRRGIDPERLAVHWRVEPDRIEADRAGVRFDLEWNDVDQVVLTRRLVVLWLGEHGAVLGLPRRATTALEETLITSWAEDSGADVVRRRSSTRPPTPTTPP